MQAGKIVDGNARIAQNFDSELAQPAHYESVMLTHDECGRLGSVRCYNRATGTESTPAAQSGAFKTRPCSRLAWVEVLHPEPGVSDRCTR